MAPASRAAGWSEPSLKGYRQEALRITFHHIGYFIVICVLLSSSPVRPASATDLARGKAMAERHCARCHVVGNYNRFGGIGSTPSFQLLVRNFKDYKARFKTFYARRPHPAFVEIKGLPRLLAHLPPNAQPIPITVQDVDAILAYAETLKLK